MLKGLRLNCLLVPAVLVLLGVVSVFIVDASQRRAYRTLILEGSAQELQLLAQETTDLPTGSGSWSTLWRVGYLGEGEIQLVDQKGPDSLDSTDPRPELIEGFARPIAWRQNGLLWTAVPVPNSDPRLSLVGVRGDPTFGPTHSAWIAAGTFLLVGALLGWYLVRRIYAPVESLIRETEAQLKGEAQPLPIRSSEMSELASVMTTLMEGYHPEGEDDSNGTKVS